MGQTFSMIMKLVVLLSIFHILAYFFLSRFFFFNCARHAYISKALLMAGLFCYVKWIHLSFPFWFQVMQRRPGLELILLVNIWF